MRGGSGEARRFVMAMVFALIAGMIVAYANPVSKLKADLRADAKGLALSLEYVANEAS